MMEFEELRKIWDEQKGETMYVINEATLHRSVTRKKNVASRRINKVEIMVSLINGGSAIFLFVLALRGSHQWGFVTGGLLAATVIYIQFFRWRRRQAENTFDRSMLGELDHAISNANAIIRFNYLMMVAYLIPLALLSLTKMIVVGASWEKWFLMIVAFSLSIFLVRWEQKACNLPRKKQLLALKKKLMEE